MLPDTLAHFIVEDPLSLLLIPQGIHKALPLHLHTLITSFMYSREFGPELLSWNHWSRVSSGAVSRRARGRVNAPKVRALESSFTYRHRKRGWSEGLGKREVACGNDDTAAASFSLCQSQTFCSTPGHPFTVLCPLYSPFLLCSFWSHYLESSHSALLCLFKSY